MNSQAEPVLEREVPTQFDPKSAGMVTREEIDQQIATANRYKREITEFTQTATQLACLNEASAQECIYALPRDGKVIEGPSARFAEIIVYSWKNTRIGARIVDEGPEFVTAQGVFMDLQQNNAITYEVKRRIVDSKGRRYKLDMIGTTANAASSIALRNAVLKGIPKAIWNPIYQRARHVVMGDFKTLTNRREEAIKAFVAYGVSVEQICATLGVRGKEDIGLEQLVVLRGILTAIQEGDTTPEQAFSAGAADQRPTINMPKTTAAADPRPTDTAVAGRGAPANVDTETGEVRPESTTGGEGSGATELGTIGDAPAGKVLVDLLKNKIKGAQGVLGEKALTEAGVAQQLGAASLDVLTAAQVHEGIRIVTRQVGS